MARTAEVKRDARIGEGTISNQLFAGASKQKVASSQHNKISSLGGLFTESVNSKSPYENTIKGRLRLDGTLRSRRRSLRRRGWLPGGRSTSFSALFGIGIFTPSWSSF